MAIPVLPKDVIDIMSSRMMRIHHYLWHETRNMWLRYDEQTKKNLRSLGWEPPRPSKDALGHWIPDNDSGEDFFFMHREMIKTVNNILDKIGQNDYPRVTGWGMIPPPNDLDYPVPPAWLTGIIEVDENLVKVKGDSYFKEIQQWERKFRDQTILKENTLGWLGANIENTIHNSMHMRWCSKLSELRPDNDSNPSPDIIDRKWDNPIYNWLGDTYSSHVNPVFWKIHGWVDDCVTVWANANKISQDNIKWKGNWNGPMQVAAKHDMALYDFMMIPTDNKNIHMSRHNHMEDLEKALSIVQQSGMFFHFYN